MISEMKCPDAKAVSALPHEVQRFVRGPEIDIDGQHREPMRRVIVLARAHDIDGAKPCLHARRRP